MYRENFKFENFSYIFSHMGIKLSLWAAFRRVKEAKKKFLISFLQFLTVVHMISTLN
jgi:hypothetical protein